MSANYCSVDGCLSKIGGGLSFFRCPKDEKRILDWKNSLGFIGEHRYANLTADDCNNRIRVCSLHFNEDCFANVARSRIHKYAVPSLGIQTLTGRNNEGSDTVILSNKMVEASMQTDLVYENFKCQKCCGATITKQTADFAKSKWKNLRDNFRVEWKKMRKGKSGDSGTRWVWYKTLRFLEDQMTLKKMKMSSHLSTAGPSSVENEDSQVEANNDNLDDIENETEGNTDTEDRSLLTAESPKNTNYNKRKRNATDNELINIEKNKRHLIESHPAHSRNTGNPKSEDGVYHFLMSLHKPMSDLPTDRQMFVRIKMQELLYNEIINSRDNTRYSTAENIVSIPNQKNIQYIDPPSVSSLCSHASSSNDDLSYKSNRCEPDRRIGRSVETDNIEIFESEEIVDNREPAGTNKATADTFKDIKIEDSDIEKEDQLENNYVDIEEYKIDISSLNRITNSTSKKRPCSSQLDYEKSPQKRVRAAISESELTKKNKSPQVM